MIESSRESNSMGSGSGPSGAEPGTPPSNTVEYPGPESSGILDAQRFRLQEVVERGELVSAYLKAVTTGDAREVAALKPNLTKMLQAVDLGIENLEPDNWSAAILSKLVPPGMFLPSFWHGADYEVSQVIVSDVDETQVPNLPGHQEEWDQLLPERKLEGIRYALEAALFLVERAAAGELCIYVSGSSFLRADASPPKTALENRLERGLIPLCPFVVAGGGEEAYELLAVPLSDRDSNALPYRRSSAYDDRVEGAKGAMGERWSGIAELIFREAESVSLLADVRELDPTARTIDATLGFNRAPNEKVIGLTEQPTARVADSGQNGGFKLYLTGPAEYCSAVLEQIESTVAGYLAENQSPEQSVILVMCEEHLFSGHPEAVASGIGRHNVDVRCFAKDTAVEFFLKAQQGGVDRAMDLMVAGQRVGRIKKIVACGDGLNDPSMVPQMVPDGIAFRAVVQEGREQDLVVKAFNEAFEKAGISGSIATPDEERYAAALRRHFSWEENDRP